MWRERTQKKILSSQRIFQLSMSCVSSFILYRSLNNEQKSNNTYKYSLIVVHAFPGRNANCEELYVNRRSVFLYHNYPVEYFVNLNWYPLDLLFQSFIISYLELPAFSDNMKVDDMNGIPKSDSVIRQIPDCSRFSWTDNSFLSYFLSDMSIMFWSRGCTKSFG